MVETANALLSYSDDMAGPRLTAARRALALDPACGPMWWLCSRLLTAPDLYTDAERALAEFTQDRTGEELLAGFVRRGPAVILGTAEQMSGALGLAGRPVAVIDTWASSSATAASLARGGVDDVRLVDVDDVGGDGASASVPVVLVESDLAGSEGFLARSGTAELLEVVRSHGAEAWLVAGVGRRVAKWAFDAAVGRAVRPGGAELVPATSVDGVVCEVGWLRSPPIPLSPGMPRVEDLIAPA